MIRKPTIFTAFSMLCALSNAQSTMPSVLDQFALQCRQVIELNDIINARQAQLDELKGNLNELKQNWLRTCNEALSSSACDDNATRINTINELIQLTDPEFEAGLLAQLKEARTNAEIRVLRPEGHPLSSQRQESAGQRNTSKKNKSAQPKQTVQSNLKTTNDSSESEKKKKENEEPVVNPTTKKQPKDNNSEKKDDSATSPTLQDSKNNAPEKQVSPEKKEDAGTKDKTKIKESKDQTNRNKTIELMNNKNKNQNK